MELLSDKDFPISPPIGQIGNDIPDPSCANSNSHDAD